MIIENDLPNEDDNEPTTSSLVSEILKKYNLIESPNEEYEKIMVDGRQPNTTVAYYLSKNFANNLISEKDFIASLETKLKISNELAGNIVKEITEKVIPFIKSINKNRATAEKPNILEQDNVLEKNLKNIISSPPKKIRKTTIPEEIKKPMIEKSQGPDNYREPID